MVETQIGRRVSGVIIHRLILARTHWTKRITWYKIGRRVSGNTRRPIFWTREKQERKSLFQVLISQI